jgi:hypothetical protein
MAEVEDLKERLRVSEMEKNGILNEVVVSIP